MELRGLPAATRNRLQPRHKNYKNDHARLKKELVRLTGAKHVSVAHRPLFFSFSFRWNFLESG